MKRILFSGLPSIFIYLMACGQPTKKSAEADVSADWKTHEEAGYMIQYPDSFDMDASGQMGARFFIFSKQTSTEDLFRENINLLIQDATGQNIDLDKFVEISESQIQTMITSGKIVESKRIKSSDNEYHRVIFTDMQDEVNLKFEQHYHMIKEKAYVLTFTCEANQFDIYKDVGEKILNSFRIK